MEDKSYKYSINFIGFREIIRNPQISCSAKVVLMDLLLYAGRDGSSFPSEVTLGKDLDLSPRQIRNLINELKDKKVISWDKGEIRKSNKYHFNDSIYQPTDELNRKYVAPQSGSGIPMKGGNGFPTNIVSEGIQLNCSQVLQLFEKIAKRPCNETDTNRLTVLCKDYTVSNVYKAIEEAGKRNLPFVKVGLIQNILEDWRKYGRPVPKPIFTPCGKKGCMDGFLSGSTRSAMTICECRIQYERIYNEWKLKSKFQN